MDIAQRDHFQAQWKRYFNDADLPLAFMYTDSPDPADQEDSRQAHRCLICNLNRVRAGHPFVFNGDMPGCLGGKRYTGYSSTIRPDFEYFLSCGIPGQVEGERYKQSPEIVRQHIAHQPPFEAPAAYLVFKRWDRLTKDDQPQAVIFLCDPDVLAGLFTLANFDWPDPQGVLAPFGSGCSSIVDYPYRELTSGSLRCILGMFDVSARPCVPHNTLSFSIPMPRFETMLVNFEASFLITRSWQRVQERIHAG